MLRKKLLKFPYDYTGGLHPQLSKHVMLRHGRIGPHLMATSELKDPTSISNYLMRLQPPAGIHQRPSCSSKLCENKSFAGAGHADHFLFVFGLRFLWISDEKTNVIECRASVWSNMHQVISTSSGGWWSCCHPHPQRMSKFHLVENFQRGERNKMLWMDESGPCAAMMVPVLEEWKREQSRDWLAWNLQFQNLAPMQTIFQLTKENLFSWGHVERLMLSPIFSQALQYVKQRMDRTQVWRWALLWVHIGKQRHLSSLPWTRYSFSCHWNTNLAVSY